MTTKIVTKYNSKWSEVQIFVNLHFSLTESLRILSCCLLNENIRNKNKPHACSIVIHIVKRLHLCTRTLWRNGSVSTCVFPHLLMICDFFISRAPRGLVFWPETCEHLVSRPVYRFLGGGGAYPCVFQAVFWAFMAPEVWRLSLQAGFV